jgi:hypothetical protein
VCQVEAHMYVCHTYVCKHRLLSVSALVAEFYRHLLPSSGASVAPKAN